MIKKLKTLVICLIALFSLTGCTEYFIRQFMHGPKFCPSDEMNKIVNNKRSFRNLITGLKRDYVVYALVNMPERTDMITLDNGQIIVADYYQMSSSKICGGEYTFGHQEAIFYHDNKLIGAGNTFFASNIKPYTTSTQRVQEYGFNYL